MTDGDSNLPHHRRWFWSLIVVVLLLASFVVSRYYQGSNLEPTPAEKDTPAWRQAQHEAIVKALELPATTPEAVARERQMILDTLR